MRDLRFVAGAVICLETFSFSASAPPFPRLGRENERPCVDVGGGAGLCVAGGGVAGRGVAGGGVAGGGWSAETSEGFWYNSLINSENPSGRGGTRSLGAAIRSIGASTEAGNLNSAQKNRIGLYTINRNTRQTRFCDLYVIHYAESMGVSVIM